MENKFNIPETPQNPYTVPEGYFEQFTERMIEQLPIEPAHKHVRIWNRMWQYAAAAVLVVGCFAGGWHFRSTSISTIDDNVCQETSDFVLSDEEIDAALDYELIRNTDISYYLTVE